MLLAASTVTTVPLISAPFSTIADTDLLIWFTPAINLTLNPVNSTCEIVSEPLVAVAMYFAISLALKTTVDPDAMLPPFILTDVSLVSTVLNEYRDVPVTTELLRADKLVAPPDITSTSFNAMRELSLVNLFETAPIRTDRTSLLISPPLVASMLTAPVDAVTVEFAPDVLASKVI